MNEVPQSDLATVRKHILSAFATPLSIYEFPNAEKMNAELRAAALEMEAKADGIHRSNAGGYHSPTDLATWDYDCVREFRERVRAYGVALTTSILRPESRDQEYNFILSSWVNISRDGQYNVIHDHPNSFWSGVYYVGVGEMAEGYPQNGKLELIDPRVGVNMIHIKGSALSNPVFVDPKPGRVVFFPSWLKHFVHPFRGEGERISIAFNINVRRKHPEEGAPE